MTVNNSEPPLSTVNEVQKNNIEQHPYKRLITIASIVFAAWGGISVAGHFIGYSFLQGRIAGHGLGEHELTLSSFESIMQAGYATKAIFDELSVSVISFFEMGILGFIITALGLGGLLKIFLWNPNEAQSKSRVRHILSTKLTVLPKRVKEILIYPTVSLFGLIFLMILSLIILNALWANLTLSYATGFRAGKADIAIKQCVGVSTLKKKDGYVASCSHFYDANKRLYIGRIIHRNKEMTLLQTNSESVLFDKNRNVIVCSAILDLALDKQVINKCTGE
ncbi:hypothetical protein NBRC116592_32160 [Colwellia sp. KU-HH00111]|uniref:hypothetical protein n=1 Tax=Colwellia sp. KU-HH00111 TaxID=3127652 RepID=UPI0031052A14